MDKLFIISFYREPSRRDVLELMDMINMWPSVRVIKEAAQPPLNADGANAQAKSVCPICGEPEYCIHCDN